MITLISPEKLWDDYISSAFKLFCFEPIYNITEIHPIKASTSCEKYF